MKPAKGLRPVISAEPLGWFQSLLARSARRDRYAEPQPGQDSRSRPHSGLRRLIGLDTGADEYRYAVDPEAGYVSAVTTRHGVLRAAHAKHLLALPRISINGRYQRVAHIRTMLSGITTPLANRGKMLVTV